MAKNVVLGSVNYHALPSELRKKLDRVKNARNLRLFVGTATALSLAPLAVYGIGAIRGHGLAFPWFQTLLAGSIATLTPGENEKVRGATLEIGQMLRDHRTHPTIAHFLSQGATHVLIDRQKNIHFVKAPEQKGRPFRPLVGRMRAPL